MILSTVSHHDWLMKRLVDNAEASFYLNALAEDNDIPFLLMGLRDVVEAQGGIGELAKKTKLSRTTLYKTLSENGNPAINTLDAILAVYGIRIGFYPIKPKGKPRDQKRAMVVASRRGRYKTSKRARS